MEALKMPSQVCIENTKFMFFGVNNPCTNFAGLKSRSAFGSDRRQATICIPDEEQAMKLQELGFNVKLSRPTDKYDAEYYIDIIAGYRNRSGEPVKNPPEIILDANGELTPLNEETVGTVDKLFDQNAIDYIDVTLRPSTFDPEHPTLYIKKMYVVEKDAIEDDPFYYKHRRDEQPEEAPF